MNQEVGVQNYEIIAQTRSGSLGTYYRVKDISNGKILLAKVSLSKVAFDSDSSDNRKSRSTQEYAEKIFNFVCEVEIHSQLFHPSIVRYIGFCKTDFNGDQYPIIFSDYPINGTLRDVLYNKKSKKKAWTKTKKFICIYGIAAAMAFLHRKQIIHFNLSPDSILLDEYLFPKISEFAASQQKTISKEKIKFDSLLYTAPEIFQDDEIDEKVDVYSFGIILNEIYSGKRPYDGIKNPFVLQSKIANNFRPEISSKKSAAPLKPLIIRCWSKDPKERPSFSEILQTLNNDTFLKNSKMEISNFDFQNYVKYINSAEKAYESNPNQIVNINDFITSGRVDLNTTPIDRKPHTLRRSTLHSSKNKLPVFDYLQQPEKRKTPLISADTSDVSANDNSQADVSEGSNENKKSSNSNNKIKIDKSDKSDKSSKVDKVSKSDKTSKSDKANKADKSDKTSKSNKSDKSDQKIEMKRIFFPAAQYLKLSPKCKEIISETEKGDHSSLKKLVNSLIEGNNGFPKDAEIAILYLKEGVKNGDPYSMYTLGDIYVQGELIPKNYRRAVSLFNQVIEKNDNYVSKAKAKLYLIQFSDDEEAKNLFNGEINYVQAKQICKEVADRGYADSMFLYGKLCLKEKVNGYGKIERNLKDAFKYLSDAVSDGSSEAMALYGQLIEQGGYGIKEGSKEEAEELFKKSHKKGNLEGEALYGYSEIESKKKEKEGLKKIIEAKEENNSTGLNAYGLVIFNGLCGKIPDEERGVYYIKLAADAGNVNAMYNYARCLQNGRGVTKNVNDAIDYYKKSLDEGCLLSSIYLGNLLTSGDKESNIDPNINEGKKYLDIASEYKISVIDQNNLNLLI